MSVLTPSRAAVAASALRTPASCPMRWPLASLVLATSCVLSSAGAQAGLREYSAQDEDSIGSANSVIARPASNTLPPLNAHLNDDIKSVFKPIESYLNSSLTTDLSSPSLVLSDNSGGSTPAVAGDDTAPTKPIAPKSQNPLPLLIPLPTAVSAGACGLSVLALLLSSPRLRRILLS
jgi:hypothetical protein